MIHHMATLLALPVLMLMLLWVEVEAVLENKGASFGGCLARMAVLMLCGGVAGLIVYYWGLLAFLSLLALGVLALIVMLVVWAEWEIVTQKGSGTAGCFTRSLLLMAMSGAVAVSLSQVW